MKPIYRKGFLAAVAIVAALGLSGCVYYPGYGYGYGGGGYGYGGGGGYYPAYGAPVSGSISIGTGWGGGWGGGWGDGDDWGDGD
ncbi:MAG: hypothetical protein ACYCZB_12550 [Acidiphilium sp.]